MKPSLLAFNALLAATVLTGWAAPGLAATNDQPSVKVGGTIQEMGVAEQLSSDLYRSAGRIYLFPKMSRLSVDARQGDNQFFAELGLGGEDVYTSNTNLTLLDMYATGPFFGFANWRVGQFKVPYGREWMNDDQLLAFNDRSIITPYFMPGRDVGAALNGNVGPASITAGVFTGGGRDNPQRYLPEVLGIPLVAARVAVGDADDDAYRFSQHDFKGDRTRQTLAASALYTRDSLVGHSTILNVRNNFDKSLLLNPAWNPYIALADKVAGEPMQGTWMQAGVDYALRTPMAGGVVSTEAELNYASFTNQVNGIDNALSISGGRLQASYMANPFEVGVRYSILFPDAKMAYTDTAKTTAAGAANPNYLKTYSILGDQSIQEITPAITYFLNGEKLKLVVDFPILLNAPIATEKGLGNYNMVNQTDQTKFAQQNAIARQFVYQIRGGIQYMF